MDPTVKQPYDINASYYCDSVCDSGCFLYSELPPGWERIEDPVYGVYYVE